MSISINNKPALLLVDIQDGLDELAYYGEVRNNPQAEEKARDLLEYWRKRGFPVFHIKHNSTNPNSPLAKGKKGNNIKEIVKPLPEEILMEKEVNSAFIGTPLQKVLLDHKIEKLVIAGLTTDHCVSSTVRMGANLGFSCFVISDATACFNKTNAEGSQFSADLVHKICLACLEGEFAKVLKAQEILDHLETINN